MPTAKEIVQNKPLTGQELKAIMLRDFERLLNRQGMLTGIMAFGRCSFEVILKIQIDNPMYPNHTLQTKSKPPSEQDKVQQPELKSLETFPLTDPSADSLIVGTTLKRDIQSPNRVRVEEGMPVTVSHRDQSGKTVEREVIYDAASLPEAPAATKENDISDQIASEAGHPELAAPDIGSAEGPAVDTYNKDMGSSILEPSNTSELESASLINQPEVEPNQEDDPELAQYLAEAQPSRNQKKRLKGHKV